MSQSTWGRYPVLNQLSRVPVFVNPDQEMNLANIRQERSCVPCPFGCYSAVPAVLAFLAFVAGTTAPSGCLFMFAPNAGPFGQDVGFGYFAREESTADMTWAYGQATTTVEIKCESWTSSEQDDLFDGVWRMGRGLAILNYIAGGILVILVTCVMACCARFNRFARKILVGSQLFAAFLSGLLLVGLASDICYPLTCHAGAGVYLAVIACVLWIAAAVATLFLKERDDINAMGHVRIQEPVDVGPDCTSPEPYTVQATLIPNLDGTVTRKTVKTINHADGSKTIETYEQIVDDTLEQPSGPPSQPDSGVYEASFPPPVLPTESVVQAAARVISDHPEKDIANPIPAPYVPHQPVDAVPATARVILEKPNEKGSPTPVPPPYAFQTSMESVCLDSKPSATP